MAKNVLLRKGAIANVELDGAATRKIVMDAALTSDEEETNSWMPQGEQDDEARSQGKEVTRQIEAHSPKKRRARQQSTDTDLSLSSDASRINFWKVYRPEIRDAKPEPDARAADLRPKG